MPKRLFTAEITVNTDFLESPAPSLTQAVAADIAASIKTGNAQTGDLIPSERNLANMYNVSRITVRNALKKLVEDQYIVSIPGVGYKVVKKKVKATLDDPVGIIYNDLSMMMGTSQSVSCIESSLASSDRSLLIAASGLEAQKENECIRRFRKAGAGALVVTPAQNGELSSELEKWISERRPAVLEGHPGKWLLSDSVSTKCDQIDVDNRDGMYQILTYLVSLGHTRIGFLCGGAFEYSERYKAYTEFLTSRNLEAKPEWQIENMKPGREGGVEGYNAIMKCSELPTACVCSNDDTALGVIDAVRAHGLKCPEDISVAGFGNESTEGVGVIAELTTVDSSRELLAQEIIEMIDARITDNRKKPEHRRIPVNLVIRSSCAPI